MGFSFAKAIATSFKKDIQTFLDRVETDTVALKKRAASTAVENLVRFSPISQGPYIKSMRVGIGHVDSSHEPFIQLDEPPYPPAMPEAEAEMLRATVLAELQAKVAMDKEVLNEIHISNSIPYAVNVETTGWKKTGPYHTFSKTIAQMEILK